MTAGKNDPHPPTPSPGLNRVKGKNAAFKFIEAILKESENCLKNSEKHFTKNLIMTKKEKQFQSSNTCWICEKLIDDGKVRDHSQINEKFRGAVHWSCNIS